MRSVTLLDSFTIPMALLLSTALLGAAYRRGHYAGAAVCVAGLLLLVATDHSGGGGGGSSNPLLGDGLVVLGATLYALCNVLQEWLLGESGQPLPLLAGRRAGCPCWVGGGGAAPPGLPRRRPIAAAQTACLAAPAHPLFGLLPLPCPGDVPVEELLGTLGLFGCLWSALQGLPLELGTLRNATWAAPVLAPFLGFGLAMFAFYSLVGGFTV